jgi:hypothetical protein
MSNSKEFAINYLNAVKHHNGSYIDEHNTQRWYNEAGQIHRDDGPAIVYRSGNSYWYFKGDMYHFFNEWIKLSEAPDKTKLLLKLQYG